MMKGVFWAVKSIMVRIHQGMRNMIRAAFDRQDQENQIPDAPPIARDGIDKINIESYTCTECKREPRSIIFKPCKDCYLCNECYTKKEDKHECDRCK